MLFNSCMYKQTRHESIVPMRFFIQLLSTYEYFHEQVCHVWDCIWFPFSYISNPSKPMSYKDIQIVNKPLKLKINIVSTGISFVFTMYVDSILLLWFYITFSLYSLLLFFSAGFALFLNHYY